VEETVKSRPVRVADAITGKTAEKKNYGR
jgi:hypothetical protein